MKKIARTLRKAFSTQYRLTVVVDGRYRNTYSADSRLLRRMARHMTGVACWSLYKSGPLFLPEREVDGSNSPVWK